MTDRSHAPISNLELFADRALHLRRERRAIPGNPQHSAIHRGTRWRLDRIVFSWIPSPPRELLSRRLVPAAPAITCGSDTLCSTEAWAAFATGFTASAQQRL